MQRSMLAVLPLLLCSACTGTLLGGNLTGLHVRITTVHENKFCEMLNATTGELLPAADWTGMLPEMLVPIYM